MLPLSLVNLYIVVPIKTINLLSIADMWRGGFGPCRRVGLVHSGPLGVIPHAAGPMAGAGGGGRGRMIE